MTDVYKYPYDPNGTAATNLIPNEQHVVNPVPYTDYHYIIPYFAPFFKEGFVIKKLPSGEVMKEGVDYVLSNRFLRASRIAAKAIYGSITFLNKSFSGVVAIKYQTLGGDYTQSNTKLAEILANKALNPRITTWEQVADMPSVFPADEHEFDVDDLVFGNDIAAPLVGIRDAIAAAAANEMKAHIAKTGNVHKLTKTDIDLGQVLNYPISTAIKARAGEDHESYMTPLRTAQAILARARGIDWVPDWADIQNIPTKFPVAEHQHPIATSILSGFMSSADKLKLDTHFINIKADGAIGDGKYHPVSEWISAGKFKTLADIQLPYPHVQALSDSIDWAVIQGALNNTRGYMVYAPPGDYVLTRGLRRTGKCLGFYGSGRGNWHAGSTVDYTKFDLGVGTNLIYYGTGPKDYEVADITNMRHAGHVHANIDVDVPLQEHLVTYSGATVKLKSDVGVPVGAESLQVSLLTQRDTFPTGNTKRLVRTGEELKARFTVASAVATKAISIGFALMDRNGLVKNWLAVATVPAKTVEGDATKWVTVEGSIAMPAGYIYAKPWIQVNDEPANAASHAWYVDKCYATHGGRSFALEGEFALTDFTNQDAVGPAPATLKKFSAGFFVEGRDGFELGNMRLVPNFFDSTQGDKDGVGLGGYRNRNSAGFGDEWDVGLFNSSTRSLQTFNLQVVGYWRNTALLHLPVDYTNHKTGYTELCKYINSTFQGMVGVSARDGDYWQIVSKTSNTITIPWSPSHRFGQTGTITLTGDIPGYRNYSGLLYDEVNLTLTFTGVGDTVQVTPGKTFIEQTDNQGTQNTVFINCEVSDLSHTSRCVEYSPAFGGMARAPGAAMELSGKNIRGLQFDNCSFYCNGPRMFHFGKSRDITFWGSRFDPKGYKLKPATSASTYSSGSVWIAGPDPKQGDDAKLFGGSDLRLIGTNGTMNNVDRSPLQPSKAAVGQYRCYNSKLFNPISFSDDSRERLMGNETLPDQVQVLWPTGGWEVADEAGNRCIRVDRDGVNVPRGSLTVGAEKYKVLDARGGSVDSLYVEPIVTTDNTAIRMLSATANQGSYIASYIRDGGGIKRRWAVMLKGSGEESGTSGGGDFYISRYNNAGDLVDNPLRISRETGVVNFIKPFTINGEQPDAEMFGALSNTGGTITGDLILDNTNNATLTLNAGANSSYSNAIYGTKAGVKRWAVVLSGGEAITTSGQGVQQLVGSEFRISRYNVAGTSATPALSIDFNTGVTNFAVLPQVAGVALSASSIGALPLAGGTMREGSNVIFAGTSSFISNQAVGTDKPGRFRIGFWDTDLRFDYSPEGVGFGTAMRINRATGNVVFFKAPKTEAGHTFITTDRIAGEAGPSMEDKIPVIRGRVMEVGKYIDFHVDDFSNDFNYRLTCDGTSNTLFGSGHFYAGGSITAMNGKVHVWNGDVQIDNVPNTDRLLTYSTHGTSRFRIGLDAAPESGNSGSNFCIHRYADDGSYLSNVLLIRRVDGQVTVTANMTIGGNLDVNDIYLRSDRRVKSNGEAITNPLDKLDMLKGELYDKAGSGRRAGIYAQDLEKVLPESVITTENGLLSIDINGPIALLIEAVKQLKARVIELEKR